MVRLRLQNPVPKQPRVLPRTLFLVAALLGASAVAGCINDEVPQTEFIATATHGTLYQGWGYDGNRTGLGNNSLLVIEVDEATNEGLITAQGTWSDGENFTITMDTFEHDADDFHSGGIAANFDEHGDSGVGNALLPRMHLLLATWGPGVFDLNGTLVPDSYGRSESWSAHVMVTNTGIRDNSDGLVKNADGLLYDPAEPGSATIDEDDLEAMVVLSSNYGNASRPDLNETIAGEVGPRSTTSHDFAVEAAGATVRLTVDFGGDTQEPGPYRLYVVGPDGNVLASQGVVATHPQRSSSATIELTANQIGNHSLLISSETLGGDYVGLIEVVHPPKPLYVLHFEEVELVKTVR